MGTALLAVDSNRRSDGKTLAPRNMHVKTSTQLPCNCIHAAQSVKCRLLVRDGGNGEDVKIRLNTHKPSTTFWIVALVLFLYGVVGLPYGFFALAISSALLLLGTTVLR